jgi:hypothetical protein
LSMVGMFDLHDVGCKLKNTHTYTTINQSSFGGTCQLEGVRKEDRPKLCKQEVTTSSEVSIVCLLLTGNIVDNTMHP